MLNNYVKKYWRYKIVKKKREKIGYEVWEYIKSDCFRYKGAYDVLTVIKFYVFNGTFRWQVAFRLCHCEGILKVIGNILWELNRNKQRLQIGKGTQIGYGLYIAHGGPVVVNPTAVIGNNFTISQFTTVGSNHEKAAVIGNNVYIGPGTSIVENVSIGNNVTIGAGSVVVKDIPDNATAAGNYAKVLNYNNPCKYVTIWPFCDK